MGKEGDTAVGFGNLIWACSSWGHRLQRAELEQLVPVAVGNICSLWPEPGRGAALMLVHALSRQVSCLPRHRLWKHKALEGEPSTKALEGERLFTFHFLLFACTCRRASGWGLPTWPRRQPWSASCCWCARTSSALLLASCATRCVGGGCWLAISGRDTAALLCCCLGAFKPLSAVECRLESFPGWRRGQPTWEASACGCRMSSWRHSAATWSSTGSSCGQLTGRIWSEHSPPGPTSQAWRCCRGRARAAGELPLVGTEPLSMVDQHDSVHILISLLL